MIIRLCFKVLVSRFFMTAPAWPSAGFESNLELTSYLVPGDIYVETLSLKG